MMCVCVDGEMWMGHANGARMGSIGKWKGETEGRTDKDRRKSGKGE